MSMSAILWAVALKTGDPIRKTVLFNMATRADDNGSCCPDLEQISQDTEIDIDTVQEKIRELMYMGIIAYAPDLEELYENKGCYRLNIPKEYQNLLYSE